MPFFGCVPWSTTTLAHNAQTGNSNKQKEPPMKTCLSVLQKFLGLSILMAGTPVFGNIVSSHLQCVGTNAYVRVINWERGCITGRQPFYQELILNSDNPSGGTIDVFLGYTPIGLNPNCDNPRGTLITTDLPLPINQGVWTVTADGSVLGEISFISGLPCRVKSI